MSQHSLPAALATSSSLLSIPQELRDVHIGDQVITALRPLRDIAYLSYDASWPPLLQRLWQSCQHAYLAFVEIGELLAAYPHDTALAELEGSAYKHWAGIEEYALPLFAAYDPSLFR